MTLCGCGCGEPPTRGRKFVIGHHNRLRTYAVNKKKRFGNHPITIRAQRPLASPSQMGSWWQPFAMGDRRYDAFLALAYERFPEASPRRSMPDFVHSPNGVPA